MEQRDINDLCDIINSISFDDISKNVFDVWLFMRSIMSRYAIYYLNEFPQEAFDVIENLNPKKRVLIITSLEIAETIIKELRTIKFKTRRARDFLRESKEIFEFSRKVLSKDFSCRVKRVSLKLLRKIENSITAASYLDIAEHKIIRLSKQVNPDGMVTQCYASLRDSHSLDYSEEIIKQTNSTLHKAFAPYKARGIFARIRYMFKKIKHMLTPKPLNKSCECMEECRFFSKSKKKPLKMGTKHLLNPSIN